MISLVFSWFFPGIKVSMAVEPRNCTLKYTESSNAQPKKNRRRKLKREMKVRVAVNAQSGRHLVASEAVKAGELLLIERAFAFAVIPSQLTSHVLRLKPGTEGGAAEEGEGEDGCC